MLNCIGDYTCQVFIEKLKYKKGKGKWYIPDFKRLWKMSSLGIFLNGPVSLFWYFKLNPGYLKLIQNIAKTKFTAS